MQHTFSQHLDRNSTVICLAFFSFRRYMHSRLLKIAYWISNDRQLFSMPCLFDKYRVTSIIETHRQWQEESAGCFIYILDSSNSSPFTFWSCKFAPTSRSNWTGIWTITWNGSWTDKHSSHFSKPKEISVKATFFFTWKPQQTNFEMMLKLC